jgi:hypothetical protein
MARELFSVSFYVKNARINTPASSRRIPFAMDFTVDER